MTTIRTFGRVPTLVEMNVCCAAVRGASTRKCDIENKLEKGYAILDELVGFCESNRTDASVNHDVTIYELRSKK